MPFVIMGFDNLKTAVEPITEEEEKSLLILWIEELNSLFPLNLDMDFVCDRFTGDNVFEDRATDRTDLVLIGASHLANIGRHLNSDLWKVSDLTVPSWRISDDSVASMVARVTSTAATVD